MERASGPASKARSVEKDTGTVNHPRVGLLTIENPAESGFDVILEPIRMQCRRAGGDQMYFFNAIKFGAHRAATVAELSGFVFQNAFAAIPPDAGPIRFEKGAIEPPGHALVTDFHIVVVHAFSVGPAPGETSTAFTAALLAVERGWARCQWLSS